MRAAIAANPAVPEPTLAALATDGSASVRCAAAANPAAALALVEAMLDDPDEGVRRTAARHYRRQGGSLARFLGVHAVGRPSLGRLIALWHPAVPVCALTAQARSIYWLERYAVARNPATPPAVRTRLGDDGNRLVAAAARRSANRNGGTDG